MISTMQLVFWIIIGGMIGLKLADIDLAPVLPIKHRSAWTHGPLFPALALLLVAAYPSTWAACASFCGAHALHLLLDIFPRQWKGSSLINLFPIPLALPPLLSFLYLLASMAASGWVLARIMGWPLAEWWRLYGI
jgi:hypothetical protein